MARKTIQIERTFPHTDDREEAEVLFEEHGVVMLLDKPEAGTYGGELWQQGGRGKRRKRFGNVTFRTGSTFWEGK